MKIVETKDLRRVFTMGDISVKALDGVDLTIAQGEMTAVTGSSGSGKSTLLYVLGCLDKPTSGDYYLNGENVATFDDNKLSEVRNNFIGFVFQSYHLIPQLNVLENVEVPLFYKGVDMQERHERSKKQIELVGLADRINHRPTELSGGEMQRVAIARALVNEPLIILADEPTGNLDSHTSEEILKIFEKLNEMGKTILMVTHEKFIASRARRTVHLRDGKIVNSK